jgi:hypothetical protein
VEIAASMLDNSALVCDVLPGYNAPQILPKRIQFPESRKLRKPDQRQMQRRPAINQPSASVAHKAQLQQNPIGH